MTKHASSSLVTFVTQAFCRLQCCPLLSAVLLSKLTIYRDLTWRRRWRRRRRPRQRERQKRNWFRLAKTWHVQHTFLYISGRQFLPSCYKLPEKTTDVTSFVLLFGKICFNQSEGTTQIWVVTRHQYGISVFVVQMSFRRKIGGCVAKYLAVFSG